MNAFRTIPAFICCFLIAIAACSDPTDPKTLLPPVDTTPPTIASSTPSGEGVAELPTITVTFSEPVRKDKLFWLDTTVTPAISVPDGVALAEVLNLEYVKSAINNPPLSATQRTKTVPCDVSLSADGKVVTMTPNAALKGETEYVVFISSKMTDQNYNKIVGSTKLNETQTFTFKTAAIADTVSPMATLVSPATGSTNIAIDTAEIRVQFDEALDPSTVTTETVALKSGDEVLVPESVSYDESTKVITISLATSDAENCQKLCTNKTYALDLRGVKDVAGNAVDASFSEQSFSSATCTDSAAPRIVQSSVNASPSDVSASITWTVDEPGTAFVEASEGDLTVECAASGPTSKCIQTYAVPVVCSISPDICALPTNESEFSCTATVKLGTLLPNKTYNVRAVSKDGGGRLSESTAIQFTTLAAIPKVVLNELSIAPNGTVLKEFVELLNPSAADVDLTGWKLARCPATTGASATCLADTKACTVPWTLAPQSGTNAMLSAGKYAIVSVSTFDETKFNATAANPLKLKASAPSGTGTTFGLSNTCAHEYKLLSPSGSVVSSYSSWLGLPDSATNKGKSFERKDPNGDDTASNWVLSSTPTTIATDFASPGRQNSATP